MNALEGEILSLLLFSDNYFEYIVHPFSQRQDTWKQSFPPWGQ